MSKKQFIKRHHLIINRLRKTPCSFNEISDYLHGCSVEDDEFYPISKRTLQRDINEILQIYCIEISYNRNRKKYEIADDVDENKTERLLETVQIYNALSIQNSVVENIILEKRKPSGTEHFHHLLFAIKNNFIITFYHQKFLDFEITERKVEPLVIKESQNRWYLVAKDSRDSEIKTFGLDRISNLKTTKEKFEKIPKILIEEKFRNAFGITTNNTKPEKIIIKATEQESRYIETLPLHHSQKFLYEKDGFQFYELFLTPTYDFISEILSFGQNIILVEPLSLKKQIRSELKKILENYREG